MRGRWCLVFGVLLACTDRKAATEGNFESAINAWLAEGRACVDLGRIPLQVDDASRLPAKRAGYDSLLAAGLLEVREGTVSDWTWASGERKRKADVYVPTESAVGAAFFENGALWLCAADAPMVTEIDRFTEPGNDVSGITRTGVEFRLRVEDVPDWASSLLGFRSWPEGWVSGKERKDRVNLALTNNGWEVTGLFVRKASGRTPLTREMLAEWREKTAAAGGENEEQQGALEEKRRSSLATQVRRAAEPSAQHDVVTRPAADSPPGIADGRRNVAEIATARKLEPREPGKRNTGRGKAVVAEGGVQRRPEEQTERRAERQAGDSYTTPSGRVVIVAPP